MSASELAHRLAEQAKRSVSRQRTYGLLAFAGSGAPRPAPGIRQKMLSAMTSELEKAVRASAAALMDGRFAALGLNWPNRDPVDLFPTDIWTVDPVTGLAWPGRDAFCFDVGYRHERRFGDVKYVWEFNRLQFLQPLAVCAGLFGDGAAAATINAAVTSWAANNPPFRGLAWASGIELGLRAFSLVFVVSVCGEALDAKVKATIGDILAAHLFWLGRYPSLYSSANNHLVAEALGEFAITMSMPQLPGTERIAEKSRRVLEREVALQIFADGVPAEQSPTYGAFTLEMALCADLLARAYGAELAPIVKERAVAFANFVGALSGLNGLTPRIGDDDEGRVLTNCASRERGYPVAIARAAAGHFHFAPLSPRSADAIELREALFPVDAAPVSADVRLLTAQLGGVTVVREARNGRRLHLTFDHGPLGYLSIAAHGHADALAITLALDDIDLLVDPGTYLYHSGGAWRDWFRGTGSHNTVRVNGADQSIISGAFNWSHKANARAGPVKTAPDWSVSASHDGYHDRYGVEHQRTITAVSNGLNILDRLDGAPTMALDIEVVYQFAHGTRVEPDGDRYKIYKDARMFAILGFSAPGAVEISSGGETPGLGGWVSPLFGERIAAPRLVWRGVCPQPGLSTSIYWNAPS